MITLCEQCFPKFAEVETLTVVPLMPCEVCGNVDPRKGGDPEAPHNHLFRIDPRVG